MRRVFVCHGPHAPSPWMSQLSTDNTRPGIQGSCGQAHRLEEAHGLDDPLVFLRRIDVQL